MSLTMEELANRLGVCVARQEDGWAVHGDLPCPVRFESERDVIAHLESRLAREEGTPAGPAPGMAQTDRAGLTKPELTKPGPAKTPTRFNSIAAARLVLLTLANTLLIGVILTAIQLVFRGHALTAALSSTARMWWFCLAVGMFLSILPKR